MYRSCISRGFSDYSQSAISNNNLFTLSMTYQQIMWDDVDSSRTHGFDEREDEQKIRRFFCIHK